MPISKTRTVMKIPERSFAFQLLERLGGLALLYSLYITGSGCDAAARWIGSVAINRRASVEPRAPSRTLWEEKIPPAEGKTELAYRER